MQRVIAAKIHAHPFVEVQCVAPAAPKGAAFPAPKTPTGCNRSCHRDFGTLPRAFSFAGPWPSVCDNHIPTTSSLLGGWNVLCDRGGTEEAGAADRAALWGGCLCPGSARVDSAFSFRGGTAEVQKTWSYPRQRCPPQAHNGDEGIFPNGTFLGRPVSCREKCAQRWSLGLLGPGAWARGISGVSFWRRDTAPWVLPGSSTGSRHSWRSVKRKADARRSSPCHQRCVCRNRMAVSVSVIVSMRRRKCSTPRSGTCSNGGYTTPAEKRDGEGHFRRRNLVKVMCLLCCLI